MLSTGLGVIIEWGIYMSNNHGVESTSPSRRSVVIGAAWAVPAVVVAGAAPTVAASPGPINFTGNACKLPGNSQDIFKGYVFELTAVNTPGPDPITGVTVISNVAINGVPVTGFQVVQKSGATCTCATCSPAGSTFCDTICTPDGATQRLLVYTNSQETSANSEFSLTFQRYECSTCTPIGGPTNLTSGVLSTPPSQGPCTIPDALPAPQLDPACANNP